MQRFITVFPTKLRHLYLSSMRCIIMISLSKPFHAGLINQCFSQPKFCTIWQSNLLRTSFSIRTVIYIIYLNVFYYTYYPQLFNGTLHTYQVCSYDGMTYSSTKITSQHWLIIYHHIIAVTQPNYFCSVHGQLHKLLIQIYN